MPKRIWGSHNRRRHNNAIYVTAKQRVSDRWRIQEDRAAAIGRQIASLTHLELSLIARSSSPSTLYSCTLPSRRSPSGRRPQRHATPFSSLFSINLRTVLVKCENNRL